MSSLIIDTSQFPGAFDTDVANGQTCTLTITGIVRRVESDFIYVTGFKGGPEYALGRVHVELMVTRVDR